MLVPTLGRVGASVTQEAAPWTRIFIGLVVNRWRCRANETVKALGYIVYIFSWGDGAGGGGRRKQV